MARRIIDEPGSVSSATEILVATCCNCKLLLIAPHQTVCLKTKLCFKERFETSHDPRDVPQEGAIGRPLGTRHRCMKRRTTEPTKLEKKRRSFYAFFFCGRMPTVLFPHVNFTHSIRGPLLDIRCNRNCCRERRLQQVGGACGGLASFGAHITWRDFLLCVPGFLLAYELQIGTRP